MVAVPSRLLLIVGKRTFVFILVIFASYIFVTALMTGFFSSNNFVPTVSDAKNNAASNSDNFKESDFYYYKGKKTKKLRKHTEEEANKENSFSTDAFNDGGQNTERSRTTFSNSSNEKLTHETKFARKSSSSTDEADRQKTNSRLTTVPQLLGLIRNANPAFNPDGNETVERSLWSELDESNITSFMRYHFNDRDHAKKSSRRSKFSITSTEQPSITLPLCPEISPYLTGKIKQAVLLMTTLKESEIIINHSNLSVGGRWKPNHCRSRHKIAIIVPFRDRQSHLNRLIEFLIPVLQRQLLDFRFIVTEQYGHDLFNKGRIMNAAFEFAEWLGVDCVVFHDVDMFPQDDRNFYGCPEFPRHMGAYVNTLGYELWYNYIVGGVLAIQADHYRQVNGYSNMYWAWGGEDDDMGYRILANNLTIERPDPILGRMTMLKHIKRSRTAPTLIGELLKTSQVRWITDGLNDTQWRTIKIIEKHLYYHLYVDVGIPPNEWRDEKPTTPAPKKS